MDADRQQRARDVIVSMEMGENWIATIDPGSPQWLEDLQRQILDAYRSGDLEWVLQHTHPEIEIVQPPEFPDGRSYHGRDGLIEALLDWPAEWEDFRIEPKRIFAVDDSQSATVAVHRGRSRSMDIEVEAEITWLFAWEDGQMRRWEMFMSVEKALSAAESNSARSD